MSFVIEIQAATDIGLKRSRNEDHFATWVPSSPSDVDRRGIVLVLADGMGGSQAGEVASRMAVDAVLESLRDGGDGEPEVVLRDAMESANHAVWAESREHPERRGMGTTLTTAVLRGPALYLGHVGDSRAWLLRRGALRQLTRDHSLVAQLVEDNHITPEQAKVDPRRNVVTRSIGVGHHVEVDVARCPEPLEPGDVVMLSSDGLHGLVPEDEIAAAASLPDLGQACDRLIELARDRGGHDNITVVLARVLEPRTP
jgi:serine/threonine protein phosphatase PrpC